MKTIYVVGMGGMGAAITFGLKKLGYNVLFVEPNPDQRKAAVEQLEAAGIPRQEIVGRFAGKVGPKFFFKKENVDLLISAAPFSCNMDIAEICFDNGVKYCDLGGNPYVSKTIHEAAEAREGSLAFTDLGMAPGHINIVAEQVAKQHNPETLIMYCGGLPKDCTNRLGYNLVFNVEGLVNEYVGMCKVLHNGEITEVEALGGYEDFVELNLEAFHTKGAFTQNMKLDGVKNCEYKTLRYINHLDYIRFLVHDCKLGYAELCGVLTNACPPTKQDLLHMMIRYGTGEPAPFFDEDLDLIHRIIEHDDHWTAMQKGTGFPAAAVASMMADGLMDGKGVLTYADVDFEEYMKRLGKIDDKVYWWGM